MGNEQTPQLRLAQHWHHQVGFDLKPRQKLGVAGTEVSGSNIGDRPRLSLVVGL